MTENIDKDLQQRIKMYLLNGPHSDTAIECDVCKTEDDEKNYIPSLKDLVARDDIDWYPVDSSVAKDETVPYGEFARMYHIARPEFIKKLGAWLNSVFYRKNN